jgi:hypothetical protein
VNCRQLAFARGSAAPKKRNGADEKSRIERKRGAIAMIMRKDRWKAIVTPAGFLMIATAMNQMSFASWQTLINNFAKDSFGATGFEIGLQQSVRELPGLLAFSATFWLLAMREQTLALVSLVILGIGIAATGLFASVFGFYITTFVMSVGFHYYETMNQSLSLQWFGKQEAPVVLGRVMSAAAFANIIAFAMIWLIAKFMPVSYRTMFLGFGILSILAGGVLAFVFPWFPQKVKQREGLVLRKRYWLYYALNFMGGARRQIFIVFAAWLMVEKFQYRPEDVAALFLINYIFNFFISPKVGRFILRFGEAAAITFENISLFFVFLAYALVSDPFWAAFLYVVDNAFFSLSIAQRTYFQKIADPADIAPTSGVAFTINHIAAVFLPFLLGIVWLYSRPAVFVCGAGFATVSLVLARFIPRDPAPGRETIFADTLVQPAQ